MKLAVLSLLFIFSANAATTVIDGGYVRGQANNSQNFAPNPFAEKNTNGWTATNITATRITSAGNQLNGISSFNLSSSTNGGTFVSSAMGVMDGVSGNCEAQTYFKASSGSSANYTFYLDNGSGTILNSVVLSNVSAWTKANFNYPCATGYKLGISHQGTATDVVQVGNFYFGAATNIGSVAQAQWVGSISATGCSAAWQIASPSTTPANFAAQTGCTYTVAGSVLAPSTNIPGFQLASAPGGTYFLSAVGFFSNSVVSQSAGAYFRFSDGTNVSNVGAVIGNTTSGTASPTFNGTITETTSQSNLTFQIQGGGASTAAVPYVGGITGQTFKIDVFRFPSQSEIAVRADTSAGVSSFTYANNCKWSNTTNSLVFPTGDATCTFAKNESGISIATIADGTGSQPGITATITTAGVYEYCFNSILSNSSTSNGAYFDVIVDDTTSISASAANASSTQTESGVSGCFPINIASTGAHTFKARIGVQSGTASLGDNFGQAYSYMGSIKKLSQNIPAPLLVGSVTSNSTGLERVERVTFGTTATTICSASPCAYVSQSGNWVSTVTRSSTGTYTVNLTAGIFSAAPSCTATAGRPGGSPPHVLWNDYVTPSTIPMILHDDPGNPQDGIVDIICMGPR